MANTVNAFLNQARAWIGCNESDGSHKKIIDTYNNNRPAGYYKMTYADAWCACFVSAVAMATNCTDIIPVEVGCERMIQLFKNKGCWNESDSRTPNAGDIIFYDWDDSGNGDNTGFSDHVGIVESVSGNTITLIEGNYSNAVKRRTIAVNARYIRGYGIPKYAGQANAAPQTPTESKPVESKPTATKKSVAEVAAEVRKGMWGNGATRINKLRAAGYDPNEVQKAVNQLMSGGTVKPTTNATTAKKTVSEVAKEVIKGKWGNGAERMNRLKAAGYDYNEVQKKVNELLKK